MDLLAAGQRPPYPYIRVYTLGEFILERLIPAHAQQPYYRDIPCDILGKRSTALTMLKILICHPQRRVSKTTLIETMWPSRDAINVTHALDTAASMLRRHILAAPESASLLTTQRIGGETIFKLPEQAWIWVDADEVLALASQAIEAEARGEDPLSYLEAANGLARGEFLEDERNLSWSQPRRLIIDGARRRVLHHLVDIHLQAQRPRRAEELLFAYLQDYPIDEDALYRLMLLLIKQQRRQEALNIYHYSMEIISEHCREPGPALRELAQRLRHSCSVHEAGLFYKTGQQEISSMMTLVA